MKNNIDARKKLLKKIAEKVEEDELDKNFADVLAADDFDSAIDEYVDMLLANEISKAFLED